MKMWEILNEKMRITCEKKVHKKSSFEEGIIIGKSEKRPLKINKQNIWKSMRKNGIW